MSADEYKVSPGEFPDGDVMRKAAHKCSMLAYCPDRPFSFCLKTWVSVDGNLMFHKVTYKHCWECLHDIR